MQGTSKSLHRCSWPAACHWGYLRQPLDQGHEILIYLAALGNSVWPISRTDRWRRCQKPDSHNDSSRVCKKLGVSEGVHIPATALGKTDRNAASKPAHEQWFVMLFSLSSYLGLQWKDFVCLFKSFLAPVPILAWTPDIWLLNSFSRVPLTNARVLLWGFTGTLRNSLAAQSCGPALPKPIFSSVMVSVQCRVSAQKHTRTVSVQIALCGPDFYTRLYGPPWLRAMEMKSMCTSELFCRNFPSCWSAFVP